jgi:hypothetical protein
MQPASVLDWRVHLFIVMCDYAMSSTAGYFGCIADPADLITRIHPGERFKRACWALVSSNLLKLLESKCRPEFTIDHGFMKLAFSEVEAAANMAGEASFDNATQAIAAFANELFSSKQPYPTIFPALDLLRRHFVIADARVRNPHFYHSPLAFALEAPSSIPMILPPTVSTNTFVEYVMALPGKWVGKNQSAEWGLQEAIQSYAGRIYSDLIRQLVSTSGPFQLEYKWLPTYVINQAIDSAKEFFRVSMNRSLDEIAA